MTKQEAIKVIQFVNFLYPRQKFGDSQMEKTSVFLASQFPNDDVEDVIEAFRDASEYSPDWIPTIPRVQVSLRNIRAARPKTPEQSFRDSHAGKSREEWEAYERWAASESGKEKIAKYKARLKQILGI